MVVEVILLLVIGVGFLCAIGVLIRAAITHRVVAKHPARPHEIQGEKLMRQAVRKAKSHQECIDLCREAYLEFRSAEIAKNGPYRRT